MLIDLNLLDTERINERSKRIDDMSTINVLKTINGEDQNVAMVIASMLPEIENAIDALYEKVKDGGRLVYIGAGTSGRLGVLDASECPPTYGVSSDMVVGIIAGGVEALYQAIEGAEDHKDQGVKDLQNINFTKEDTLVGLAASGRTPYVIGALEYANKLGAVTASISCVRNAEVSKVSQYPMEAIVGPEVVTGSTRMKAGTAQKLILNMISTTIMIKLGKVYGNLMVDVKATNAKLKVRAKRMIEMTTPYQGEDAERLYEESGQSVKTAIIMPKTDLSREEAEQMMEINEGRISKTIEAFEKKEKTKHDE